MFRDCGWREARVDTLIRLSLQLTPLTSIGETRREPLVTETVNEGYKVDNFRDRIALDVEWNAKDGNLDRDIGAYRALYDAALIDGGVLVTRTLDLRDLGRGLAKVAGVPEAQAKRILNTTTTTNSEKLLPRLTRGDAGGCPILAVFIAKQTHVPDQVAGSRANTIHSEDPIWREPWPRLCVSKCTTFHCRRQAMAGPPFLPIRRGASQTAREK
jgi:hypothetical protein